MSDVTRWVSAGLWLTMAVLSARLGRFYARLPAVAPPRASRAEHVFAVGAVFMSAAFVLAQRTVVALALMAVGFACLIAALIMGNTRSRD